MPSRKKKFRKKKAVSPCSKRKTINAPKHNASGDTKSRPSSSNQSKKSKKTVNEDSVIPPFNRFATSKNSRTVDSNKNIKMPYHGSDRPSMGLSSKERSYVICSCQARSNRYLQLKKLAANAIKTNKIFTIYGSCSMVRQALVDRGWVEKITPNKMNLSKLRNGSFSSRCEVLTELERLLLSNIVEKYPPSFIWRTRDQREPTTIDMDYKKFQPITYPLTNKLKIDAQFTSKQGLCSSMKRNYWFYIEDIAEVNGPRTYSYDAGEVEEFVKDFKITACTSLLKWILSMVSNERRVFVDSGKISINLVVFALNRCREYLFRKQNKDIDVSLPATSQGQWNAFLKQYYRIIAKDDVFEGDKDNKLPLYLGYAKILLKEIHKYRPQLSCEGCHNIWIIKPTHNSRGRGIRMASKLGVIKNLMDKANSKYVIQKYIEEPLLIHETKFDIRQYYLVTSTVPLVIWMYRECYLKFSSQKYNLKNYHESIHLTNNAVQRKYKNCQGRHADLPLNNMWDSNTYRSYLNSIGKDRVWNKIIYPGMKKSIIGIMLSCQDYITVCKNRFELYGCDFILDKEYRPWLIEINSCPDLNPTTAVTGKMCPAVLSDIIKVVVDFPNNSRAPTGNFECVYRQPMTVPRYYAAPELLVRGYALSNEYFYRGPLQMTEPIPAADIEGARDMKMLLNKLKRFKDTDIMVEPDEDDSKVFLNEAETQNTESGHELNAETSSINQLDDLMDRITSELSDTSVTEESVKLETQLVSDIVTPSSKSLTDVKSLIDKPVSRFASMEAIEIKSFKFGLQSLDDPEGGSQHKKVSGNHFDLALECEQSEAISYGNLVQATTKILSFINIKEKEYLSNVCNDETSFESGR